MTSAPQPSPMRQLDEHWDGSEPYTGVLRAKFTSRPTEDELFTMARQLEKLSAIPGHSFTCIGYRLTPDEDRAGRKFWRASFYMR